MKITTGSTHQVVLGVTAADVKQSNPRISNTSVSNSNDKNHRELTWLSGGLLMVLLETDKLKA